MNMNSSLFDTTLKFPNVFVDFLMIDFCAASRFEESLDRFFFIRSPSCPHFSLNTTFLRCVIDIFRDLTERNSRQINVLKMKPKKMNMLNKL